jgi:tetratricopeptide (TPR) repeat protein
VALAVAATFAAAPPGPVERSPEAIAAERSALSDPGLSAAERLSSVERLLEARAELIREHRDDLRRAGWLADQASDLLFVLLPIESSGLTSLFGLPAATQRARAQRVARQMNELAAQAELEIERAILALESAPGYADDHAARMERRRLTEAERDRRIPFLRGVGACLHAQLNERDASRAEGLYRLAADRLRPLARVLPGRSANLARLYAGLALAGLGEHDAALLLLNRVAADPKAQRGDAFAARMVRVSISAARGELAAALGELDAVERRHDGPDDLFFRVLIADQRFRLCRDAAGHVKGNRRDQLVRQAFAAYIDLLGDLPGIPPHQVRAVVLDRLIRAVDDGTPLERLEPIVAVARAEQLAGRPETRAQGVALFQQLLERRDLDAQERAEVLFGLARAHLAEGRLLEAARHFARVASEHPTSRHAEPSVELAAAIAEELHRRTPRDPDARSLLRATLDLLLNRYPNMATVDRWRFSAGCLALDEGRHESALGLFEQVTPDAEQWLDAQFGRARVARSWAKAAASPADRRQRCDRALAVIEAVRPVLRQALADAGDGVQAAPLRDRLAALRVFEAEALLSLGEPQQALETLEGVADDCSLAADAVLARIDAYAALGRGGDMERELDRLLEVAPKRAGAILSSMLEARRPAVMSLLRRDRIEETTALARRDLVPPAAALNRWLASADADGTDRTGLELAAADAYLLAERRHDALRLYDGLLQRRPNALEALFGRAECLFGLGMDREAEAMDLYKRISAATAGAGGEYYWQSQLRMLQILSRTGRNTHRIAPHIQRLRQKDPQLGGERLRRQFERLQAKHSGG